MCVLHEGRAQSGNAQNETKRIKMERIETANFSLSWPAAIDLSFKCCIKQAVAI
jgi:hypothetical protein